MPAHKKAETVNYLMKTTRYLLCFREASPKGSHRFSTLNDLIPFLLQISMAKNFHQIQRFIREHNESIQNQQM